MHSVPAASMAGMAVSLIISVGVPIALMIIAKIKLKAKMINALIGAGTFIVFALILEQILHTAMVAAFGTALTGNLPVRVLYGGLAAGLFEETGRLFSMKLFMKKSISKENAVMYGIGHGGIESILIAGLTAVSNLIMSFTINAGQLETILAPLDQNTRQLTMSQISGLWTIPSWQFYISGVERILAIALQLCLSYTVYLAVKNRRYIYYVIAIALHMAADSVVVMVSRNAGIIWAETVMFIGVAIYCLFIYKSFKGEKKMINTVVFDMDGTVLNTLEDLTNSVNYVMDRFGMPAHTIEEYRKVFGSGIRYAIEQSVPEGTDSSTVDEMLPVFKEHYDVHCLDKTAPYEGILDLMRELKKRGYKMAIVSNKIDSAVKELNERFFSEAVSVAIGEKPGINRKPAPDTVFEALRELGSSVDEAVYVGDSEVDFATAKNSGLPCISVLWGFRSKEYLESIGANCFAESPADVLTILSQKTPSPKDHSEPKNPVPKRP